jgi:conjugative transfer region lipoprotein (TIGR03751 family)
VSRILIKHGLVALLALQAMGCASDNEKVLPHGPATMLDLWETHTQAKGASSGRVDPVIAARATLKQGPIPIAPAADRSAIHYSRTSENEINAQFKRLPNPDLVMFVFPHLSGSEEAPIPGYSTIFPMHSRVKYALPGERTEEY